MRKRRKSSGTNKYVLAPSEQTLPKYKLVQGKGRTWWFEPDGVEPLFNPDAGPGEPPCPAREHERQLRDWLELARRCSAAPECVAATQSLRREYQQQIAEFQRWRRRTDFARECWAREAEKVRQQGGQVAPELPSQLIEPRPGERAVVDPRLMQWAGDLGRHVLAQSDPVTALARLLNKRRPANRPTVNTERNQEIRSYIAIAKANGASLQDAFKNAALAWDLSEKQVREIYYGGPKAARYSL
jgi:hypothetical protein